MVEESETLPPNAGSLGLGKGLEPSGEGDVLYSPRGVWHGFNNTSKEDVLVWGGRVPVRSMLSATKFCREDIRDPILVAEFHQSGRPA